VKSQHELSEDKAQARYVSWCRQHKIFIFAIANQQPMAACCENKSIVRRILKKLFRIGLEEGMPDLMIPIPTHGYHGLFVEMKTKTGKAASEQKVLLSWLSDRKYKCIVCHSAEEAILQTKMYFNKPE